MKVDDVRRLVRSEAEKVGGMSAYCRKHKLSRGSVVNQLNGLTPPGPTLLGLLGLRKVVTVDYVQDR